MMNFDEKDLQGIQELDDDQLDSVVGGASIGDVVKIHSCKVIYCPGCGK